MNCVSRLLLFIHLGFSVGLIPVVFSNQFLVIADCSAILRDSRPSNIHYIKDNDKTVQISTYSIGSKHPRIDQIVEQILELQKPLLVDTISDPQLTEGDVTQGFLYDKVNRKDLEEWLQGSYFRIHAACKETQLVGYVILLPIEEFQKWYENPLGLQGSLNDPTFKSEWQKFITDEKNKYVRQIAVHRALRGKGIGKILLNECKRENPTGLLADIYDDPKTHHVNTTSDRLFFKNHFLHVGQITPKNPSQGEQTSQTSTMKACPTKIVIWQNHSTSPIYFSADIDKDKNGDLIRAAVMEVVARSDAKREDVVRSLLGSAFEAFHQKYNVMVFDLTQPYTEQLEGVQLYATFVYKDLMFGVWVFEKGDFQNNGVGAFVNWAFKGVFVREKETPGKVQFFSGKVFNYSIGIRNRGSQRVLGQFGNSLEASDDEINERDRQWDVVPSDSGYFTMKNRKTGKVVDHDDGKFMQPSNDVIKNPEAQWEADTAPASFGYSAEQNNFGYFALKNRKSGMFLEHFVGRSIRALSTVKDFHCQWELLLMSGKCLVLPGMGGMRVAFALKNRSTGMLLDHEEGEQIQAWDDSHDDHDIDECLCHQWEVIPTDSGYFKLKNKKSEMVLACDWENAAQARPQTCSSIIEDLNHQWRAVPTDSGYFVLESRVKRMVLAHEGENGQDEIQIQQRLYCEGGDPRLKQQWLFRLTLLKGMDRQELSSTTCTLNRACSLSGVGGIKNRATKMLVAHYKQKSIQAVQEVQEVTDDSACLCYQWEVVPTDSGYFKLINKTSKMALVHYKGKFIQAFDGSGDDPYYQWEAVPTDSGYIALRNRGSSLVLDHYYEKSIEALSDDVHHHHHQWQFLPIHLNQTPEERRARSIISGIDASFAIKNRESKKILEHCDGKFVACDDTDIKTSHHRWNVVPSDPGYFAFQNQGSGMVLDHFKQTIILALNCNITDPHHQWEVVPTSTDPRYFTFQNRASGMVLDHYDGKCIQAFNSDKLNPAHHWQFLLLDLKRAQEGQEATASLSRVRAIFAIENRSTSKVLAHHFGESIQALDDDRAIWTHQWEIVPTDTDWFALKNRKSEKFLGHNTDGLGLIEAMHTDFQDHSRQWKAVPKSSGNFALQNRKSHQFLKHSHGEGPITSEGSLDNSEWQFLLVELDKK